MATPTPARKAPPAKKGHGLTSEWHGIPVWGIGVAGLVVAYLLYKHFTSSSSSSSSTPSVAATTGTGTGSSGSGGYSGGGSGGGWGGNGNGSNPGNPGNPPVPGATWGSPCPGMPAQWIPPGAVYNCPNIPSTSVSTVTPSTSVSTAPTTKSISTVTPAQAQAAQTAIAQAQAAQAAKAAAQAQAARQSQQQSVQSLSATSPAVTTSSGQATTTGALAYHNLTSAGYSPEAALQASQLIAAASSGYAPGTPQLIAGTPVTSGSVSATNAYGQPMGVYTSNYVPPSGPMVGGESPVGQTYWCGRQGKTLPVGVPC